MNISRRNFLKVLGITSIGAILSPAEALMALPVKDMKPTDTVVWWVRIKNRWVMKSGNKQTVEECLQTIYFDGDDYLKNNIESFRSRDTIGEIRIWNRALSTEEINQIFEKNRHRYVM